MDKRELKSEQRSVADRKQQHEALANPQHFYPRPEDVLSDNSLSSDEKRVLLDNWLVLLEDKAGALGKPHGPGDDDPRHENQAMIEAIAAARAQLQ